MIKTYVACVDSGASTVVMAREVYHAHKHFLGPLQPLQSDERLRGATGVKMQIDGIVRVPFKIGEFTYSFEAYVGDLVGVPMLLGMPFLCGVNARIDYGAMTAIFGPQQIVDLDVDCLLSGDNEVRTKRPINIPAKHAVMVACKTLTKWGKVYGLKEDVHFRGNGINFYQDLEVVDSLVRPDSQGDIRVCLVNHSTEVRRIASGISLGSVDPLVKLDGKQKGCYHIYEVLLYSPGA